MTSHFLLMVVFALLVSTVFAVLLRDEPRAQLQTGVKMFAAFVGLGDRVRLADVPAAALIPGHS